MVRLDLFVNSKLLNKRSFLPVRGGEFIGKTMRYNVLLFISSLPFQVLLASPDLLPLYSNQNFYHI
ncbi:MAG: hypothetical protein D3909_11770 [Candidatus Electrothrix sp. ATG1]|nr:hypothetical protein [Candidatus Electrothrix sp. ATG1]